MDAQHIDSETPLRRTRRRIVLAALVSLAVAAGAVTWTTRSTGRGHRLVYMETLPDGRVFQCFSDGAFLGAAGTAAEGGHAPPAPEGAERGPVMVVRPPDYTEEEARRAMEEYRTSGRSPEKDQADFDRLSAECRQRR